jgi:hypothetical protein
VFDEWQLGQGGRHGTAGADRKQGWKFTRDRVLGGVFFNNITDSF